MILCHCFSFAILIHSQSDPSVFARYFISTVLYIWYITSCAQWLLTDRSIYPHEICGIPYCLSLGIHDHTYVLPKIGPLRECCTNHSSSCMSKRSWCLFLSTWGHPTTHVSFVFASPSENLTEKAFTRLRELRSLYLQCKKVPPFTHQKRAKI